MVKSYNDPVKQLAREKLREFIKKHLLSFRKPKDLKVVCFPGAEIEGEEALEVKEVFDPLGIPRENITGLEIDVEKAERLRKANLGIQVFSSADLDFFKTASSQFDIVSLDYTGQQTDERLEALEYLVGRQLLNKYSVLCTNYAGKRESDKMQKKLFHKFTRFWLDENRTMRELKEEDGGARIDILEGRLQGYVPPEMSQEDIRDAITFEVIRILKIGRRNITVPDICNSFPFKDEVLDEMKETLKHSMETDEYKRSRKSLVEAGIFPSHEYFDELHRNPSTNMNIIQSALYGRLTKELLDSLVRGDSIPFRKVADEISFLIETKELKNYFPVKMERYSYNSNKNALMFTDLFYSEAGEKYLAGVDDLVSIRREPFSISWNPRHQTPIRLAKKIHQMISAIDNAERTPVPKREYLGSSWKPPERINRKNAIELLASGCSPKEIAELYPGTSVGRIAAWKAHMTMGTYKKADDDNKGQLALE